MIITIPNSVGMRENTDQKNFEYRHFSRSEQLALQIFTYLNFSLEF